MVNILLFSFIEFASGFAPTPHSPPIATPNMARSTSRTVRLGALI